MTGTLLVSNEKVPQYKAFKIRENGDWPPKFTKFEIIFDNNVRLVYCDPRRIGRIKLTYDAPHTPPISLLARDPLLEVCDADYLQTELSKWKAPIKAVLLDQSKVICGVGNWIADEVYYSNYDSNTIISFIIRLLYY